MGAIRGHHDCHRLPDIPDDFASKWILCARQQRRDARPKPGLPAGSAKYRQGKKRRPRRPRRERRSDRFCEFARGREGCAVQRRAKLPARSDHRRNSPGHAGDGGPRAAGPAPPSSLRPLSTLQKRPAFAIALRMSKGVGRIGISKVPRAIGHGGRRPAYCMADHFAPFDRYYRRLADRVAFWVTVLAPVNGAFASLSCAQQSRIAVRSAARSFPATPRWRIHSRVR